MESSAKTKGSARFLIRISDLPTLPNTLMEILKIANEPTASLAEIEAVVKKDQSLTARVLQVANSAFYGSRTLGSLGQSMKMLGLRQIQNVAASMAVAPQFDTKGSELIDGVQLWSHALACAGWCQHLAKELKVFQTDHLFTAGLMHDIGITVLARLALEREDEVLRAVRDQELSLVETEEQILGINHARLGALLCAKWQLPPHLTRLIAAHHNIELPEETDAQILILADHLTERLAMGEFSWTKPGSIPDGLLDALRISPERLEEIVETTTPHVEAMVASIADCSTS
ncbi:MAG: HDOD domain-containing protein [Nannocystaceae bacterium]